MYVAWIARCLLSDWLKLLGCFVTCATFSGDPTRLPRPPAKPNWNCHVIANLTFIWDSFGILSGFFEFFWNCTGLLKIPYDSQIFQIVQSPLNIWDYQRLSGILIHSVRMFEIPTNCRVFCKRILHSIFDFFFWRWIRLLSRRARGGTPRRHD